MGKETIAPVTANDAAAPTQPRRTPVALAIVAGAVLFLACTSLLFYRYITVHEPTSGIMVYGNASLENAIVSVQPKQSLRVLEMRLSPQLHYRARFFMDPGEYNLSVTTAEGDVIYLESLDVYAGYPQTIDLSRLRPQTRPS